MPLTGEWNQYTRTPEGNLCNPIQCLFHGKFPWEVTGDVLRAKGLVSTCHTKPALLKKLGK